jgi:O-Antigen ligase
LITARDIPNLWRPSVAIAPATAFRERLLLMVLYVTVFASSVAFIEPSPHDFLMGVLAFACLIAGVRFDRQVALLFILLLTFNAGGLLSLLNVPGQEKTVQYAATSIYLALAAIVFACLFAERTMPRLAAMRSAYVLTATLVSFAGICGYFHAFPGAEGLFAPYGRALGAFKDPNVFGPFLIWPTLIVLERMIVRRVTPLDLAIVAILLLGLLLSFSRGAWFHLAVSGAVTIALAFLTAPNPRLRMRIFALTVIVIAALAAVIAVALSSETVAAMFRERFHLVQSYDVGEGGRFKLQELALAALLKFPNGMGPFEFSRVHGLQQHNVYLQAFMVYGWIGGMSYILMLAATFMVALRSVFIATPWQHYLITAFAAFTGEVLEGFVIDTDHWRHFFLLLGVIWGLGAATVKFRRQSAMPGGQAVHVHA